MVPAPTPLTDGAFNRITTTRFTEDDTKYSVRGDWNVSEKDKIFGRFSYWNSGQLQTSVIPFNGTESPYHTRNAVLSWTRVISPNLVNEARVGLNRAFLNTATPENAAGNPDWPTIFGLKNLNDNPLCNGPTSISLEGYSSLGFTFQNCIITGNNNYHFVDNLAYNRGRHSLSFGGQFVRNQYRDIAGFTPTASLQYTGQFSGNSFADFLLGDPFVVSGGKTGTWYRFGIDYDLYANDNFKVTKNLTLNFGLRYQYISPLTDKFDIQGTLDFKTGKILVAGKNGEPRTVIQKDRNDFAPRFGFAWAPGGSQKWSVRSSYGIFYDRIPGNELLWTGLIPPFVTGQAFVSDQKRPTIDVSSLFPTLSGDPNNFKDVFLFNLSDRRSPYVQQWTFSVQRTLGSQFFAEAAYIGSKGTKFSKRVDSNVAPLPALDDPRPLQERRPFPQYSFILDDRGFSNSSYNGLLLSLRKVYSHGLITQGSFTWSKSLDNDSYDGKATRNYRLTDLDRGRSIHDIKFRFVYNVNYELPFGKNLKGVPRQVIHGWEVNSIVTWQSGAPFHAYTFADPSDTGAIFNHYPNRTCNGNLPRGQGTREKWFDTSCFSLPAFRTYGDAGVQYLDGPGYRNVDFSLNKNFPIGEQKQIQFRSEYFNLFNFVNRNKPDGGLESPTFGVISGAGSARVIQFGLKFNW
ncbi:MAG: hypothetical protein HY236_17820 [Acidobacteria bacterium]|nr:hypothetical protein [Acidobacteriota bacterium]